MNLEQPKCEHPEEYRITAKPWIDPATKDIYSASYCSLCDTQLSETKYFAQRIR